MLLCKFSLSIQNNNILLFWIYIKIILNLLTRIIKLLHLIIAFQNKELHIKIKRLLPMHGYIDFHHWIRILPI